MPVIKATVTRASNGTVDLRPIDPDSSDVEVITLAVPNALDMAKKFQPDTVVEVDVPEGTRKAQVEVAIVLAEDESDDTPRSKRKKA